MTATMSCAHGEGWGFVGIGRVQAGCEVATMWCRVVGQLTPCASKLKRQGVKRRSANRSKSTWL